MYYTYMLRCEGNSIYTGITNDLNKRMKAHFLKGKTGAKYTKSHNAVKVEAAWQCKEKALACRLECYIKNLSKKEKEELLENKKLSQYLKGRIDGRKYHAVNLAKVVNEEYWGGRNEGNI